MPSILDAPLPPHWGLVQRWKNHLIYVVVRVAFWCVQWIPMALMKPPVILLGYLAWLVDFPDRRRALNNVQQALPELRPAEQRRIVRRMFVHLAISALEATRVDRLLADTQRVDLGDDNRALFAAALEEGNGVVAVGGHIGNWELLAQTIAKAGYPVSGIAKPVYDPRLTRWVDQQRSARGMKVLWRGDSGVPKAMLRIFRNNGILAMLIDQDTRVHGAFVPFFGRPAHTPTAASSMALRTGAPVLVGWCHRRGGRHHFHFERCDIERSDDHAADVVRLTAKLSERLEAGIRQAPEQWVWLHDRWKKQPEVESAPTAELDLNTAPPP